MWRGTVSFITPDLAKEIGFTFEKEGEIIACPGVSFYSDVELTNEQYNMLKTHKKEGKTNAYWELTSYPETYEDYKVSDLLYVLRSRDNGDMMTIEKIRLQETVANEESNLIITDVALFCFDGEKTIILDDPTHTRTPYTVITKEYALNEQRKWEEIVAKLS